MVADFDHIATDYDEDFTESIIGKAQRNLVYSNLELLNIKWDNSTVLELNCGTGEDALYLGKKGASIIATDISKEMVAVSKQKTSSIPNIIVQQLDIREINTNTFNQKFDVIFSNFGGLNCLTPEDLKNFLEIAPQLLTPAGKLIMVIMPSISVWESFYYLSKFKFSQAFRRLNNKGIEANVDGKMVKTYYYSPLKIVKWANKFKMDLISPIGLTVPPSYLSNFFTEKSKIIQKMEGFDQKRADSFYLSSISDHFLISLSLR